ncbi:MAG TPA: O-antigen ligase family protein, partial [Clostridia bacterium]|nr:O-antigen ligase family protein [Clostridia bacterium]
WKAPAWLLGPKNNHFPLLLFSLLLSSLRAARRKRSLGLDARAVWMALAVGLTAVLLASGNTLFSMALALLFLCLPRRLKTWPAFRMDALLAVAAGVFVLLVVLRVQDMFRVLIVDVLGKQLDFTGRTSVWDAALYWIRKSPWIGYGVEELSDITRKLGFYFAVNAHNELLQMLYHGGIPLMAVFLWMLWLLVRRLKAQSAPTALCATFVFALLLSTQFEVYSTLSLFFLLLLLAYHCDTATALPREKAVNDG